MDLKIKFYDNDDIVYEEIFDGRGFYNGCLLALVKKYNIVNLPLSLFENTSKSLENRLNYTFDDKVITNLKKIISDDDEKILLDMITNDEYEINDVYEFYQMARRLSIGNLEDITGVMEDNDLNEDTINKIVFIKE